MLISIVFLGAQSSIIGDGCVLLIQFKAVQTSAYYQFLSVSIPIVKGRFRNRMIVFLFAINRSDLRLHSGLGLGSKPFYQQQTLSFDGQAFFSTNFSSFLIVLVFLPFLLHFSVLILLY